MKKSIAPSGKSFFSSFFDGHETDWIHLVIGFLLSDFVPSREAVEDCIAVDSDIPFLPLFRPKLKFMESCSLFLLGFDRGRLCKYLRLLVVVLILCCTETARDGLKAAACDAIAAIRKTVCIAEELLIVSLWSPVVNWWVSVASFVHSAVGIDRVEWVDWGAVQQSTRDWWHRSTGVFKKDRLCWVFLLSRCSDFNWCFHE